MQLSWPQNNTLDRCFDATNRSLSLCEEAKDSDNFPIENKLSLLDYPDKKYEQCNYGMIAVND